MKTTKILFGFLMAGALMQESMAIEVIRPSGNKIVLPIPDDLKPRLSDNKPIQLLEENLDLGAQETCKSFSIFKVNNKVHNVSFPNKSPIEIPGIKKISLLDNQEILISLGVPNENLTQDDWIEHINSFARLLAFEEPLKNLNIASLTGYIDLKEKSEQADKFLNDVIKKTPFNEKEEIKQGIRWYYFGSYADKVSNVIYKTLIIIKDKKVEEIPQIPQTQKLILRKKQKKIF